MCRPSFIPCNIRVLDENGELGVQEDEEVPEQFVETVDTVLEEQEEEEQFRVDEEDEDADDEDTVVDQESRAFESATKQLAFAVAVRGGVNFEDDVGGSV